MSRDIHRHIDMVAEEQVFASVYICGYISLFIYMCTCVCTYVSIHLKHVSTHRE